MVTMVYTLLKFSKFSKFEKWIHLKLLHFYEYTLIMVFIIIYTCTAIINSDCSFLTKRVYCVNVTLILSMVYQLSGRRFSGLFLPVYGIMKKEKKRSYMNTFVQIFLSTYALIFLRVELLGQGGVVYLAL